jgi:hypothetical protein
VYEGNFYQKFKVKSQTIEVLHQCFLKKTPPTLLGRGESSKKRNNKIDQLGEE